MRRIEREPLAIILIGSRIVKLAEFETAYITANDQKPDKDSFIVEMIYGRRTVPVASGTFAYCKQVLEDLMIVNPPTIEVYHHEEE